VTGTTRSLNQTLGEPLGKWLHPLPCRGLLEPHAVTCGDADMGMVHETVDCRLASVFGMSSSKPDGCKFELTAIERRS